MTDDELYRLQARVSAVELLLSWIVAKQVLSSNEPKLEIRTISNDINQLLENDMSTGALQNEVGLRVQEEVDHLIKATTARAWLE